MNSKRRARRGSYGSSFIRFVRRKPANHKDAQLLAAAVMVVTAFAILFWRFFAYDVTVSVVAENAEVPAIVDDVKPSAEGVTVSVNIDDSVALDATVEPEAMAADGPKDVPERPFDATLPESALVDAPVPSDAQPQPDLSQQPVPESAGIGVPVRFQIPSIGVDAAIEQVGLTTDGSMGVPQDPMNAAWYELGPSPGETGSAVIAGHVDWYGGATGVFANLDKVRPGDTVTVHDDSGAAISFVVREIRVYAAAEDAAAVFISTDGKAHLNLITCDGTWNKDAQQYSERLVVFTDKE